jgi:hypothetical protein
VTQDDAGRKALSVRAQCSCALSIQPRANDNKGHYSNTAKWSFLGTF